MWIKWCFVRVSGLGVGMIYNEPWKLTLNYYELCQYKELIVRNELVWKNGGWLRIKQVSIVFMGIILSRPLQLIRKSKIFIKVE